MNPTLVIVALVERRGAPLCCRVSAELTRSCFWQE